MADSNPYSNPDMAKSDERTPSHLTLGAKPLVVSLFFALFGSLCILRLAAFIRFLDMYVEVDGVFAVREALIGVNGVFLVFIAWKVAGLRKGTSREHAFVWLLLSVEAGTGSSVDSVFTHTDYVGCDVPPPLIKTPPRRNTPQNKSMNRSVLARVLPPRLARCVEWAGRPVISNVTWLNGVAENILVEENPYSPPDADPNVAGGRLSPGSWLITTSCWLAILLRFSPLGGDLAFSFTHRYGTAGYLATSSTFHAAVLIPAAIFMTRNGTRSWALAPKRLVAVSIVTAIAIMMDVAMLSRG